MEIFEDKKQSSEIGQHISMNNGNLRSIDKHCISIIKKKQKTKTFNLCVRSSREFNINPE